MCYRKLKELIKHNNIISRIENRPLDNEQKVKLFSFQRGKKLRTDTLHTYGLVFSDE